MDTKAHDKAPPATEVPLLLCQRIMGGIWLFGGLILFWLAFQQSNSPLFQGHTADFWAWFGPTIVPYVTLIFSSSAFVEVRNSRENAEPVRMVSRFALNAAAGLSVVYLLVVFSYLIRSAHIDDMALALDMLHSSSYVISLFQGLIGLSLGLFFESRSRKPEPPEAAKVPATATEPAASAQTEEPS